MNTTVNVICLCGKNTETLQLDSQLPVQVAWCSCNICRYSTGVLHSSRILLTSKPRAVDNLTKYNSSPKSSRYFCTTCGSHMFVHLTKDDSWSVCSGVIDHVVGREQVSCLSLEKILQHVFVGDTKDGGLAVCLADFDGHSVPLFSQGPEGASFEMALEARSMSPRSLPKPGPSGFPVGATGIAGSAKVADQLDARCHCGGVNFSITRPNAASKQCMSPWPDLLVPYHSSSSENPQDIKWWLRANESKYLAGTCACRSCRLGSGVPIQSWAFIPKANIFQANGNPLTYDMGTLRQIESSKDCFREFCNACGATVFWHCRERPDIVDVSVGLLRAEEGSRAESWLQWCTDRVSFKEHAVDQALVSHLERGLKKIIVEE